MRDRQHRRRLPPDAAQVQLQADREHVQDHAELGDDPQVRRDVLRQQIVVGRRPQMPQQRRPQRNAGDHFADYRRLANQAKQPAQHLPGSDDRGQGEQDVPENKFGVHINPKRKQGTLRLW